MCLVSVASSVLGLNIRASETCRADVGRCQPGTTSGRAAVEALGCHDGTNCKAPLSFCEGGSIGPGTFFDPAIYLCDLGRIRQRGIQGYVVHSGG